MSDIIIIIIIVTVTKKKNKIKNNIIFVFENLLIDGNSSRIFMVVFKLSLWRQYIIIG